MKTQQPNIFHRFETSSKSERAEMAHELKLHYNSLIQEERNAFAAIREAKTTTASRLARIPHVEAMAALGHVQAVFDILGIEYDPGEPFHLGLFDNRSA